MTTPALELTPVAYDFEGAALAVGLSPKTIQRAVRAGELPQHFPSIDGRDLAKPLILREDLHAWVLRGSLVRERD